MRSILALAVLTGLVVAPAPAAEGAGADRPRVALSVSPARLELAAPTSRRIRLRNDGAERVVVDVTPRAVGLPAATKTWFHIVPTRLVVRSGETGVLALRATPPRPAEPGRHQVLVLLTTRSLRGGRVSVQLRLAVRVDLVVPGRIVRQLTLGGLRVQRAVRARFLLVSVANRGNVTIQLRGRISASLSRRGRRLARLTPPRRRALAPRARAVLALRYSGRASGLITAVVRVRLGPGLRVVQRRYRIRL